MNTLSELLYHSNVTAYSVLLILLAIMMIVLRLYVCLMEFNRRRSERLSFDVCLCMLICLRLEANLIKL